ncbi:MAG: CoA transferase, partial [Candidatus Limnocylindrales bacterium]
RIIGRDVVVSETWFQNHTGRLEHKDELDAMISAWIGERTSEDVLQAFEQFEAAIAPIYSIADILVDPQYIARETFTTVKDPRLGSARVQNVIPRMSRTPGRIRHLGADLGAHNREIYVDCLGYREADLEDWRRDSVI